MRFKIPLFKVSKGTGQWRFLQKLKKVIDNLCPVEIVGEVLIREEVYLIHAAFLLRFCP